MALEFDTDVDTDFSEPPPVGKYHVTTIEVVEENDKGNMDLTFEVLAGTIKGMEGRTHRTTFFMTTKMARWFHRLAIVGGLITQKQLDEMKAKGETASYDFTKLKGRQFMVEVTKDKSEDGTKEYSRIQPWHIWSPDDPFCSGWPKNEKWLKDGGYEVQSSGKSSGKQEAPAKSEEELLDGLV